MRTILGLVTGTTLLAGLAAGAQAMPLAPVATIDAPAALTLVRDGCGPGGFRDDFGDCRRDRRFGGPRFDGPRFDGPRFGPPRIFGGYGEGRRCFVRETYDGPRRICRW